MAEKLPAWMRSVAAFAAPTPPAEMPVAFAFRVSLLHMPGQPNPVTASFQEVSGLEHALDTEDVAEGGENHFVHQLPKQPRPRRLQLKRGLVQRDSSFVSWCRRSLQGGLETPLQLIDLQVQLIDAQRRPLMVWGCNKAYPVRWTINGFESQRNEVAIEEIELAYQTLVSPT
ncbi:phage tail protein [Mitsuaria sp. WAJ17]|uniref:phage tail protein n=1 Tax=Mitsuaria sp. WAJ17 TaxID=2761452 RepID=UPI0015FFA164|nr:phage tail protein [Mitsuaria sp. WAJ17]MBB2486920.1 phage tail protein [Mitsuaria sp. WAJ17]